VRRSANNPFAGLTAPQSSAADLNHEPTVASMKRAEARMKSKFSANLARTKALDKRRDRAGCARSLDAAKRMYIL
jgi:hypothetical protein